MVWNHEVENNANRSPQAQPQRRQEGEGAGDLPGDFVWKQINKPNKTTNKQIQPSNKTNQDTYHI